MRMIRPASKNTGMATTRPVMPSAHAAFSSPNFRTMVTAKVCAPPDSSRMAPNMEPRPTRRAMPFKVLPMPSFTEPMMSDRGIPAIRPMPTAPIRMEIMAWILNLMMRTSNRIRPATAAKTSRAASGVATAVIEISSVSLFFGCTYPGRPAKPARRFTACCLRGTFYSMYAPFMGLTAC